MSFDRSQIPRLHPAPTPLEVVPGFAVDHQVTLILKESFDNFSIADIDGQPVINVKSRFGLSRKKDFVDSYGNTVFSLKGKKYSFTGTDSSKREVLTVSSPVMSNGARHSVISSIDGKAFTDTKLDATFVNTNTHTPETVNITGKWPGDIVELFWRGHLVGLIMRQLTRRDMLGQNTYLLTVAPNVDLCLMAALCVCVDERREAT